MENVQDTIRMRRTTVRIPRFASLASTARAAGTCWTCGGQKTRPVRAQHARQVIMGDGGANLDPQVLASSARTVMFSRAEISYDMHRSALELGCERCPLGDWQRSPAGSASKEQCTCDPSKLVQPCANCSSGCRCFDNHRITTGAIVEKGKRVGTWKSCEKCVEGEECPPISCVEGGTKGRVNSSVFVASCWLLLTLAFQEQWTYETY